MADLTGSILFTAEADLSPLERSFLEAMNRYKKLDDQLKKTAQELLKTTDPDKALQLKTQIAGIEKEMRDLEKTTKAAGMDKSLKQATTEATKLYNEGKKVDDVFKDVGQTANRNTSAFTGLKNTWTEFTVAIAGTTVALSKVVDFFKEGIVAAGNFEYQMGQVATMLGDSANQYMPQYMDQVKQLSLQTGESLDVLTNSLYNTLSAGVSAADSMEFLDVATRTARAGAATTAEGVDAITTAVNAFTNYTYSAADIADILFQTIKGGKTTLTEINASLGMVVGGANAAGISFEEVGAALATLTAQGQKTANATTALNALFAELSTADSIAKFKALGIEIVDSQGLLKDLGEIATEVMEKNLNPQQMGTLISSQEAKRAFMGLVTAAETSSGEIVSALEAQLNNFSPEALTGSMDSAYAVMEDQFNVSVDKMGQAWEIFSMNMGEQIKPTIEEILGLLTNVTNYINEILGMQVPEESGWQAFFHTMNLATTSEADTADTVKTLSRELEQQTTAMAELGNITGQAIASGEGYNEVLAKAREIAPELTGELENLFDENGNLIGSEDELIDRLKDFNDALLAPNLGELGENLTKLMDDLNDYSDRFGTINDTTDYSVRQAQAFLEANAEIVAQVMENTGLENPAIGRQYELLQKITNLQSIKNGEGALSVDQQESLNEYLAEYRDIEETIGALQQMYIRGQITQEQVAEQLAKDGREQEEIQRTINALEAGRQQYYEDQAAALGVSKELYETMNELGVTSLEQARQKISLIREELNERKTAAELEIRIVQRNQQALEDAYIQAMRNTTSGFNAAAYGQAYIQESSQLEAQMDAAEAALEAINNAINELDRLSRQQQQTPPPTTTPGAGGSTASAVGAIIKDNTAALESQLKILKETNDEERARLELEERNRTSLQALTDEYNELVNKRAALQIAPSGETPAAQEKRLQDIEDINKRIAILNVEQTTNQDDFNESLRGEYQIQQDINTETRRQLELQQQQARNQEQFEYDRQVESLERQLMFLDIIDENERKRLELEYAHRDILDELEFKLNNQLINREEYTTELAQENNLYALQTQLLQAQIKPARDLTAEAKENYRIHREFQERALEREERRRNIEYEQREAQREYIEDLEYRERLSEASTDRQRRQITLARDRILFEEEIRKKLQEQGYVGQELEDLIERELAVFDDIKGVTNDILANIRSQYNLVMSNGNIQQQLRANFQDYAQKVRDINEAYEEGNITLDERNELLEKSREIYKKTANDIKNVKEKSATPTNFSQLLFGVESDTNEWTDFQKQWADIIDIAGSTLTNTIASAITDAFSGNYIAWDKMLGDTVGVGLTAGIEAAVPGLGTVLSPIIQSLSSGLFGLFETAAERAEKRIKRLEKHTAAIKDDMESAANTWEMITDYTDIEYTSLTQLESIFGKIITDEDERIKLQQEWIYWIDEANKAEREGNTERQRYAEDQAQIRLDQLDGYEEYLDYMAAEEDRLDRILRKRREELGIIQDITGETAAGLIANIGASFDVLKEQFTTENFETFMADLDNALQSGAISWTEYNDWVSQAQAQANANNQEFLDAQSEYNAALKKKGDDFLRFISLISHPESWSDDDLNFITTTLGNLGTTTQEVAQMGINELGALFNSSTFYTKPITDAKSEMDDLADSTIGLNEVLAMLGEGATLDTYLKAQGEQLSNSTALLEDNYEMLEIDEQRAAFINSDLIPSIQKEIDNAKLLVDYYSEVDENGVLINGTLQDQFDAQSNLNSLLNKKTELEQESLDLLKAQNSETTTMSDKQRALLKQREALERQGQTSGYTPDLVRQIATVTQLIDAETVPSFQVGGYTGNWQGLAYLHPHETVIPDYKMVGGISNSSTTNHISKSASINININAAGYGANDVANMVANDWTKNGVDRLNQAFKQVGLNDIRHIA